ncbi:MAG TPA: hypothetical protein VEZ52_05045 [Desulfovibrio sp.]|uniref:hypothetical protein n=1 Tax=Desulfovibrio sp. TaxID=885 RepID=UPI002D59C8F0|nr:hypothetical protein [Desulfovibrio sp.]HZF60972.1 hypothetical protein [Desulfovibrio sp.]
MQFDPSTAPKLWFKRVVLFRSLNPVAVIREIKLYRGLNIVEGRSSRDPTLSNNPMAMAGHSVGKTTFCRLLRYCLGEQHFSTAGSEQCLRSSLPHTWIGAELEIEGVPWAVLRSLGAQKAQSSAQRDASIEELVATTKKDSGYFEFRQELDRLMPSTVHHPELTYKWEHLLSWLARDQECRLRKFEVWRDSDSGSESPGFRKPKEYPIHLVRGMLDLLVPEESKWSHTVSELTSRLGALKEQYRTSMLDADYFYRAASKRLAEFIGEFPDTRNDITPRIDGPIMQAEIRQAGLLHQHMELEQQFEEADANFRKEQRYVDNALERKRQIDALRVATPPVLQAATTKPLSEYAEKKKELAKLTAQVDDGGECMLANQMPLSKCEHIAAYMKDLEKFKPILNLPTERQKLALAEMNAQQREKIQTIIQQQNAADAALKEAEHRAEYYKTKRNSVLKKLSALENQMDRLSRTLRDFQNAEKANMSGGQEAEAQRVKENLDKLDSEIHHARNQLEFYRDQSAKKDQGVQKLFDEIVRRILKADYSGSVITSADGFAPQIRQGSTITGAAVESLSFVLMDIASMLASSRGIGQHPGFLIHDSPREADLDIGPYNSLLTELAMITTEKGGEDCAPFQYIITTTTPPPDALNPLVRLALAAYPEEEMLFRQRLKREMPLGHMLEG